MSDQEDEDDLILRYAMHGAAQHERMPGDNMRAKDAFFDSMMSKTLKLQTKKKLLEAYGQAFVCQDGNCKVCNAYRDGEPLKCRTCHGQVRPKEPSQQEVCQFHKSYECLDMPGWNEDGKAPDKFVTEAEYQRVKGNLPKYRSAGDFIVGYHKPRTVYDEDWGIKKCGCIVHIFNWETCNYCSPGHYKTTNYSVQWRHYVDTERIKTSVTNAPLVYNKDYYNRIFEILVEENKDVNRTIEAPIDYDDCDHEIFRAACNFCDRLPMPGDEPYKRCGQCKQAKYCGSECQKAAWPIHKKSCQKTAGDIEAPDVTPAIDAV
jgi:hypothetical protein